MHAEKLLTPLTAWLVAATLATATVVVAGQASRQAPASTSLPAAQQAEAAELARQSQAALSQGDFQSAVRGYEKLVKMAPGVAEFHSNLGMAYYSSGRPLEASRAFQQALKLKPALTAARYFLAASLAEAGQCKEALPLILKDSPRIADPRLKRLLETDGVRCALALDQSDTAIDLLRPLNHDFPDDPEVLYLTAHVYSDLSTRASQHLLVTAPGSLQAHQLNAEVLELQGQWEDAITEYRKILEMNPRTTGIHYRLGGALLSGPRGPTTLEEARREFAAELELDPEDAGAEYELGEMARQARQWPEAIQHFSRAIQLDPQFVAAHIGLGKSLVSAGQAPQAVAPLESAVKLAPDDPVARYQLAFAYRRVGRDSDAEKELAAYRRLHVKAQQTSQNIRVAILGRMTQEQTEEPPE